MNVFFDNCTPPLYAAVLDTYFREAGSSDRAYHIRDVPLLPGGRSAKDVEWIKHLRDDEATWVFVTGDQRMRRNPAERAAIRSSEMHGFMLANAYQSTPPNQVCAVLLWKWPEIEKLCGLLRPPSLNEIPVGRLTKLRQLPL